MEPTAFSTPGSAETSDATSSGSCTTALPPTNVERQAEDKETKTAQAIVALALRVVQATEAAAYLIS